MRKKRDTKQLLIESLLDLSKSTPVEKISVRKIVDNCGIGRQTFYNHFRDKYDLIDYFYYSNTDRIINENVYKKPWKDIIIATLRFFYENRQFFKSALKETGQLAFINSCYEYTENMYIVYIKKCNNNKIAEDVLFQIEFNCYGAVSMLKKWFMNDMDRTPEEIGTNIWDAMPGKMKHFFENDKE